jgi:DNA polymerase IIIc chi subunit
MSQISDERKKAIIFSKNKVKEIDDSLWIYGKFIPHITVFDEKFITTFSSERHPIFITNKEENANNANYLVLTDDVSDGFLSSFERVFYFYDERNLQDIKNFHSNAIKSFDVINSYKKNNGKWIKEIL